VVLSHTSGGNDGLAVWERSCLDRQETYRRRHMTTTLIPLLRSVQLPWPGIFVYKYFMIGRNMLHADTGIRYRPAGTGCSFPTGNDYI
jgi:hypothetical protein